MHIEFWNSGSKYLAMVNGNGLNKMLPQTFKVETNTERERGTKKMEKSCSKALSYEKDHKIIHHESQRQTQKFTPMATPSCTSVLNSGSE